MPPKHHYVSTSDLCSIADLYRSLRGLQERYRTFVSAKANSRRRSDNVCYCYFFFFHYIFLFEYLFFAFYRPYKQTSFSTTCALVVCISKAFQQNLNVRLSFAYSYRLYLLKYQSICKDYKQFDCFCGSGSGSNRCHKGGKVAIDASTIGLLRYVICCCCCCGKCGRRAKRSFAYLRKALVTLESFLMIDAIADCLRYARAIFTAFSDEGEASLQCGTIGARGSMQPLVASRFGLPTVEPFIGLSAFI